MENQQIAQDESEQKTVKVVIVDSGVWKQILSS